MIENKQRVIEEFERLKLIARMKHFGSYYSRQSHYQAVPRELWPRFRVIYESEDELRAAHAVCPRGAYVEYVSRDDVLRQKDYLRLFLEIIFSDKSKVVVLRGGKDSGKTLLERIRGRRF